MATRKQQPSLIDKVEQIAESTAQAAQAATEAAQAAVKAADSSPEKQLYTCVTSLFVSDVLYLPGEQVLLTEQQVALAADGSIAGPAVVPEQQTELPAAGNVEPSKSPEPSEVK